MKQHYTHIHLYVQQLYRNSRPHEELETFYAASLQEEAQRMYSTYFVAYLKMLIGRLSEMDDLINLKKLMKEVRKMGKVYGYIRVSSTDQNEDRQRIALHYLSLE